VLAGFLASWVPWQLSPRISFMYHMLPSVPFGCLAIAYALSRIRETRIVVLGYMLPVLIAFIYFYPIYSAWPISKDYLEQHYWISPRYPCVATRLPDS
jgi:dolichyl-phosphate-mannose--protein O-mannosyl transferase